MMNDFNVIPENVISSRKKMNNIFFASNTFEYIFQNVFLRFVFGILWYFGIKITTIA